MLFLQRTARTTEKKPGNKNKKGNKPVHDAMDLKSQEMKNVCKSMQI